MGRSAKIRHRRRRREERSGRRDARIAARAEARRKREEQTKEVRIDQFLAAKPKTATARKKAAVSRSGHVLKQRG